MRLSCLRAVGSGTTADNVLNTSACRIRKVFSLRSTIGIALIVRRHPGFAPPSINERTCNGLCLTGKPWARMSGTCPHTVKACHNNGRLDIWPTQRRGRENEGQTEATMGDVADSETLEIRLRPSLISRLRPS